MKKSVKTSNGLDHQNTPVEHLHQNHAHMNITMGKQPVSPVAFVQWHNGTIRWYIYSVPYLELLQRVFSHFTKATNKNGWSACVSSFEKQFFFKENCILRKN